MNNECVILTQDSELLDRVRQFLEQSLEGRTLHAESCDAAFQQISGQSAPTVILDARLGQSVSESALFLEAVVAGRLPAVNVITVQESHLPVELAALADLLSQVVLPANEDWSQSETVVESLREIFSSRRAQPVPRRFVVEAGELEIATYTPALFPVLENLLRVAHRDVTLLIIGATGTGKTTLAKFIHNRSASRDRPFQTLACGALPADLIESELFGHARGAFTGADRNKIGRFQAAGHGTLLLDEIDVLEPKQQAKLLRVIETGEYEMVGSTETRLSEARLVVASNVNLEALTETSKFRADLYYRLNVLEFPLPLLKDRPLDIVSLAMEFVMECSRKHDIEIHAVNRDFLDALKRYPWPGNIRELKNHIRRAVLFCETQERSVNDLSPTILRAQFFEQNEHSQAPGSPGGWTLSDRVAQSEKEMLQDALKAHGNNRTATAKALGLSRVGLYKKLRRLGIVKSQTVGGRQ
jgi:DNA-binding NtrC family response regulator